MRELLQFGQFALTLISWLMGSSFPYNPIIIVSANLFWNYVLETEKSKTIQMEIEVKK
jgi:hypothetical protein